MTLCGAFRCHDGIVMFADRQESIADYAKWEGTSAKFICIRSMACIAS